MYAFFPTPDLRRRGASVSLSSASRLPCADHASREPAQIPRDITDRGIPGDVGARTFSDRIKAVTLPYVARFRAVHVHRSRAPVDGNEEHQRQTRTCLVTSRINEYS